jgi:hypothetical protein
MTPIVAANKRPYPRSVGVTRNAKEISPRLVDVLALIRFMGPRSTRSRESNRPTDLAASELAARSRLAPTARYRHDKCGPAPAIRSRRVPHRLSTRVGADA